VAAPLLARAGRIDEALGCLEVSLVKSDVASTLDPYAAAVLRLGADHPAARRAERNLADLFPEDTKGWKDPMAWFEAAAKRLQEWHAAGRIDGGTLQQALPLLATRLHAGGRQALAAELLAQAQILGAGAPRAQLAVRDSARHLGNEALAVSIERDLLARRVLPVASIAEVVGRVAKTDGDAAALALAESAAAYTLHPELLERLVGLAKTLGDVKRVERWEGVQKEAAAARQANPAPRAAGEGRARGTR
jgi:hypothetical protein